jgi:hypothetical protein
LAGSCAIGKKSVYLEFKRFIGLSINVFECIAKSLENNKCLETIILNDTWAYQKKSSCDSIQQILANNRKERIFRTRFMLLAFLEIQKCSISVGFDKQILDFYFFKFFK